MQDYYEILEVSKSASVETIKGAYRALSKKYHPDVSMIDKHTAESKMKIINEAYAVLSNSLERQKYDRDISLSLSNENLHIRRDDKAKRETEVEAKSQRKQKAPQKQYEKCQDKKVLKFRSKRQKLRSKIILAVVFFILGTILASGLLNSNGVLRTHANGLVFSTRAYSEKDELYKELKSAKTSIDEMVQRLSSMNNTISNIKGQYELVGGNDLYNTYKSKVEEYNGLYEEYSNASDDYKLMVERYNELVNE